MGSEVFGMSELYTTSAALTWQSSRFPWRRVHPGNLKEATRVGCCCRLGIETPGLSQTLRDRLQMRGGVGSQQYIH